MALGEHSQSGPFHIIMGYLPLYNCLTIPYAATLTAPNNMWNTIYNMFVLFSSNSYDGAGVIGRKNKDKVNKDLYSQACAWQTAFTTRYVVYLSEY